MFRRHLAHGTDFKRLVVAEFHAGKALHALGHRHDLSRDLNRTCIITARRMISGDVSK